MLPKVYWKLGEKFMQAKSWLSKFKLALINEDVNTLENLLNNPDYKEDELEQVKALTKEAIKFINQKKDSLAIDMKKAKLAKEYIKA